MRGFVFSSRQRRGTLSLKDAEIFETMFLADVVVVTISQQADGLSSRE